MKPRIAITADTYMDATNSTNLQRAPYVSRELVEVLSALGCIPFILPDVPNAIGEDYFELYDGLIVHGGPDVDPHLFGEEPRREIGMVNYKRDVFERELIQATVKVRKPILGICKGAQIINVALGGDLYQDIKTQCPNSYIKHSQKAPGGYPTHSITVAKDSFLHAVLGLNTLVNSRHHQAIREVAPSLKVTATSLAGIVEGIENNDASVVGVQWHPENMWREHEDMYALFEAFVSKVKERM